MLTFKVVPNLKMNRNFQNQPNLNPETQSWQLPYYYTWTNTNKLHGYVMS